MDIKVCTKKCFILGFYCMSTLLLGACGSGGGSGGVSDDGSGSSPENTDPDVNTLPATASWTKTLDVDDTVINFNDVETNGPRLIAVGTDGFIYISEDGLSWSEAISGTTEDIRAVSWNGSYYLATTYRGILTSSDGVNWTVNNNTTTTGHSDQPSSRVGTVTDITWNGSEWYGAGEYLSYGSYRGNIIRSVDGVDWEIVFDESTQLDDITYVNNTYFAVGGLGIFYSYDGINWLTSSLTSYSIRDVIWDGSRYVNIGWVLSSDVKLTQVSNDGINWVNSYQETSSNNLGQGMFFSVVATGDSYIASGLAYTYISSDGSDWTQDQLLDDGGIMCTSKVYKYGENVIATCQGALWIRQ